MLCSRMQRLYTNYVSIYFVTLTAFIGLVLGSAGCSQYSDRSMSKGYHNLTAHYNAYFIAKVKMDEVEKLRFENRKENYNQLLPILIPVDSLEAQPMQAQLDDVIKKASMVAERHQNSKWLDNAYNLIGKVRLYREDYLNAVEVFKYVNTKGTNADDKHEALILLMQTYTETGDFPNALNVAEFLRTQPLNAANTKAFYLTKANLHQRKGEYAVAAAILDATFPSLKKGEATARLHLAAGQLYDLANQPAKAAAHYQAVLKNRPLYDQAFYANMYLLQSTDPRQAAKANSTFERMLRDRKNEDLKDKIYYTMGLLEARKGQYDRALALYRISIQETTTNTAQIPYTYLEMGKLYFEKKQQFEAARAYYDSALALLPQQSPDFAAVQGRKKTLDDFVKHLTIVRTEDSLQHLTTLSPDALEKVLSAAVARKAKEDEAKAELARKVIEKATGQPTNAGMSMPGATNSNLAPDQRWILYNPNRMAQGKQEFMQRWGNRPLEDNWRRQTKDAPNVTAATTVAAPANSTASAPATGDANAPGLPTELASSFNSGQPSPKARRDAMYASIPFSAEARNQSNQRLDESLYQLGKIYKFQLNQPKDAVKTFESHAGRFPGSQHRPEVYYLLYLTNEQLGIQTNWRDKLLREFPNTSYARLANRTNRSEQPTTGTEAVAAKTYTDIYNLYRSGNHTEALARSENALTSFAGTQIEDKLALLRTILTGHVHGAEKYRQAITDFIRDYPSSPLLPYVKELQTTADQATAKRK